MILGRELPTWKQIAGSANTTQKPFMEVNGALLFAESCQSLKAVMRAVKKVRAKDTITLWMPDYFCNQTLACFREEWLSVSYYPVGHDLEPDWKVIREHAKGIKETGKLPDIFLFVHYFGVAHDISKARDFCNNNSVILIEDCAHCLYPHPMGAIGQKGDFVIYSQHKQLPISDGAVLVANPDAAKSDMRDEIAKVTAETAAIHAASDRRGSMNDWYMKKAVQKLMPFVHRGLTYSFATHFGDERMRPYPIERISDKSYAILAGYSYEDYKRIAYIRRDNLRIMNEAVRKRIPRVEVLNEPSDLETPYMGVYSLRNLDEGEKEAAVKRLLDEDFTVLYWPDLPYDLRDMKDASCDFDDHSRAYELSRDIFVIPAIHQDVTPQQLVKKFLKGTDTSDDASAPAEAGPISILHEKNGSKVDVRTANLHLIWELTDEPSSTELPLPPKKSSESNSMLDDAKTALERPSTTSSTVSPLPPKKSSESDPMLDVCSDFQSEWADIYERAATTNIPQDYIYGEAKAATEGWGLRRALVKNDEDETVGVLQVLIKKIKGVSAAARVNRGPVLLAEYDCVENHIAVMRELRKTIKSPMPIAWAPFVVWTADNFKALTEAGWRCTDPYAYPSGYLDLSQTEEELEKNMQSFWRKHLKQAKKQVDIQINRYSASEVRALYSQFLRMKDIPGIPDAIIEYLFRYMMDKDASANTGSSLPPKKSSEDNPVLADAVISDRETTKTPRDAVINDGDLSKGSGVRLPSDDFSGGGGNLTPDPETDSSDSTTHSPGKYNVLEVLTAHNKDGAMIAYKVLYRHGNTGTSFIAWNTDEGRDKQARTYLIFESALRLKELGCRFYDLGGIDDITTEAVARFKRGTGDTDYRLLGEFMSI